MVIVQGTFRVAPGDRDAFLAQSIAGMVDSRAEPGCIEYVMAADPVEADRVVLSERWASMEDLEAHLQRASQRRSANTGAGAAASTAAFGGRSSLTVSGRAGTPGCFWMRKEYRQPRASWITTPGGRR